MFVRTYVLALRVHLCSVFSLLIHISGLGKTVLFVPGNGSCPSEIPSRGPPQVCTRTDSRTHQYIHTYICAVCLKFNTHTHTHTDTVASLYNAGLASNTALL